MPFPLPAPDKRRLTRSPLALVVCQVKFEELIAPSDARTAVAFHDALGGRSGPYPKLEQAISQTINVVGGPGGVQSSAQPRQGWRLRSAEGHWTVVLMPDHVVLETSRYTTWSDDFEPRLNNLLRATALHIEPALEQRLGLRYVDRITEPAVQAPGEWREYINLTFLGAILDDQIEGSIRAAQQQIDVDLGDGIAAGVRHGFFADPSRDGSPTYLLDVDVYRETGQAFDVAGIMATLNIFHERNLQVFQRVMTPKMLDYLRSGDE